MRYYVIPLLLLLSLSYAYATDCATLKTDCNSICDQICQDALKEGYKAQSLCCSEGICSNTYDTDYCSIPEYIQCAQNTINQYHTCITNCVNQYKNTEDKTQRSEIRAHCRTPCYETYETQLYDGCIQNNCQKYCEQKGYNQSSYRKMKTAGWGKCECSQTTSSSTTTTTHTTTTIVTDLYQNSEADASIYMCSNKYEHQTPENNDLTHSLIRDYLMNIDFSSIPWLGNKIEEIKNNHRDPWETKIKNIINKYNIQDTSPTAVINQALQQKQPEICYAVMRYDRGEITNWNEDTISSCHSQLALATNNPSICENIQWYCWRKKCYWNIGETTENQQICENMPTEWYDRCIHSTAHNKQDTSICTLINDQGRKQNCILCIAAETRNNQSCSLIQNSEYRDKCIRMVGHWKCWGREPVYSVTSMATSTGVRA